MVKAGFTYLSQNPSYYAQQLTHELGIEGDLSSDQILEILQSKSVEEIADRNNLVSTFLIVFSLIIRKSESYRNVIYTFF
jgi:hypothetical protein